MPMDVLNGAAFTGVPLLGAWNWGLGGLPATAGVQAVAGADIYLQGAAAPSEIHRADSAIEPPAKMASTQWFVLEDLVGTISAGMRVTAQGGFDIQARYSDFMDGAKAKSLVRDIRARHAGELTEDVHEAIFQSPDPERAVVELVSNGIDWSQVGQDVEVNIKDGVFEVTDHGRGIDFLRIFEKLIVPKLTDSTDTKERIGRFGIGFYTVLRYLVSPDCTNPSDYQKHLIEGAMVEVQTSDGSGVGHIIQYAVSGKKIRAAIKQVEGALESGTRIRVLSPRVKAAKVIGSVVSKMRYSRGPVGVIVNGQKINTPVPCERELKISDGVVLRWMPDAQNSEAVVLAGDPLIERYTGGLGSAKGSLVVELPRTTKLSIVREGIEVNGNASGWFGKLVDLSDRDDIFGNLSDRLGFLNIVAALAAGLERDNRNLSEISFIEMVRTKIAEVTKGKRIYPDEAGLVRALQTDSGNVHIIAQSAYPAEGWQTFESPKEYQSGWMEDDAGLKKPVRVFITPDLKDDVYVDRKNGVVWIAKAAYEGCDPATWDAFFLAAQKLGVHIEWHKLSSISPPLPALSKVEGMGGDQGEGVRTQALPPLPSPLPRGERELQDPLFAPPTEEEKQAFAGFKFLEEMGVKPTDALPTVSHMFSDKAEAVVSNGKRYVATTTKGQGSFLFCEDRGRVRLILEGRNIQLIKYKDRVFVIRSIEDGGDELYDVEDIEHPLIAGVEKLIATDDGILIASNVHSNGGGCAVFDLENPAQAVWQDDFSSVDGYRICFSDGSRAVLLKIGGKTTFLMYTGERNYLFDPKTRTEISLPGQEEDDRIQVEGDLIFVRNDNRLTVFHRDNLKVPLGIFKESGWLIAQKLNERLYQLMDEDEYTSPVTCLLLEYDSVSRTLKLGKERFRTEMPRFSGETIIAQRQDGVWVKSTRGIDEWMEIFPADVTEVELTDDGKFVIGSTNDAVIIKSALDPDWQKTIPADVIAGATIKDVFRCGERAYAVLESSGDYRLCDLDDPHRSDIDTIGIGYNRLGYSKRFAISATKPHRLVSLSGDGIHKDFSPEYRIMYFAGDFWRLLDKDAEARGENRWVIVEEGTWKETVIHNMLAGPHMTPRGFGLSITGDERFHYVISPDEGVRTLEMGDVIDAPDSLGKLIVFLQDGNQPRVVPLSLYNRAVLPENRKMPGRPRVHSPEIWQRFSDPKYQARVRELARHDMFPIADHIPAVLHARDDLWERLIADPERRHFIRYLNGRGFEGYLVSHPKARRELEWVAYLDERFGPFFERRVETFVRRMERLIASSIDIAQVISDLKAGRQSEDAMAVKTYLEANDDSLLIDGDGLIKIDGTWDGSTPLARAVGLFRMGQTGRFAKFASSGGAASEVDRRAITHVVDNLRVGSPFAFMGQLLRGARKRMNLGGKESVRITTSLVDGRMQLDIEFPSAMGEDAMVEELVHINGHEMGKGLLGALKGAEWVRVESSGDGRFSSRVRTEVARQDGGEFNLRWHRGRGDSKQAGTTKIKIRMAGANPFLDAARLSVHLEEIGRYYTGGSDIIFNGRKLNEGATVARARAHVEGLGEVSLYEGYGERLLVGGLKVMDIPASVMDTVAEGIRKLFGRQGFLIDLDEKEVGLVPSGERLVDQDAVLSRLKKVLPGLLVQAFLSRVMDPSRREDIRSLPDTYFFDIYEMAKDSTLGDNVIRDAKAINKGRPGDVDYARYENERELLKLMTLLNFIPHRGRNISIRDLYEMVQDAKRADEAAQILPSLPETLQKRIKWELEHRKGRESWRTTAASASGPGPNREWGRASTELSSSYALYLEFLESVIGAYFDGAIVTGVQTYSAEAGVYAMHYLQHGTYHLLRTLSGSMEVDVREFVAALEAMKAGEGREKFDKLLAKTIEVITHELTHVYTETRREGTHDPKFYLYQLGIIPRARRKRLDSAVILAQMLEKARATDLTVPPWQSAVH